MATKLEEIKETLAQRFEAETDQNNLGLLSDLMNKCDEALAEQQKSSDNYNKLLGDYKQIILKSGNAIKSSVVTETAQNTAQKINLDDFITTEYSKILNKN